MPRRCSRALSSLHRVVVLVQTALAISLLACGGGGPEGSDDESAAPDAVPPALEGRDSQQGPIDRGGGAPPLIGSRSIVGQRRDTAQAVAGNADPRQVGRFSA